MLYEEYVYFQIEPSQMTFVNRIVEGVDHIGVLTALDGKRGIAFYGLLPIRRRKCGNCFEICRSPYAFSPIKKHWRRNGIRLDEGTCYDKDGEIGSARVNVR